MKLSFSIPSKSSSSTHKPKTSLPSSHHHQIGEDQQEEVKEYVTEFDPSKTLEPKPNSITKIIPPIHNEYHPHKRMKNLHLPDSADHAALRFEVESLSSAAADDKMSYGLNVRQQTTDNDSNEDNKAKLQFESEKTKNTEDVLLAKLKYDLNRLPEDRGFEEFEDMPVESFAKALLAGYNWHEGKGVGKNAKEDVKVKQYDKRAGRHGLGYDAQPDSNNQDKDKLKEKRRGEKEKDGFFIGKDVRVIGGRREDTVGSKGTIVERLDSNWFVLKLVKTGEKVKVSVVDIADLGSKEEEKCLKKLKKLNIRQVSNGDHERRKTEPSTQGRERAKRGNGEMRVDPLPQRERGVQWLRNHIRVRVISKDLKRGNLYGKKGEVVDVVGPYLCDISMDESRELIQSVDQDLLETALPRRGGPVLVLYGKYKGVYGNLVQKDLDQETGVVQESGTHELLNVKLGQVAEYIGDPSYIGY